MAANTETLFRSREAPSWRARKTLDASEPVHLLRAIGAGECNKGGKILRVAGGGVTPEEKKGRKGILFFNIIKTPRTRVYIQCAYMNTT